MSRLGYMHHVLGADKLENLPIEGRPSEMPALNDGEQVYVCLQEGETAILCELASLDEMQSLYAHYKGLNLGIQIIWLKGPKISVMESIEELCGGIMGSYVIMLSIYKDHGEKKAWEALSRISNLPEDERYEALKRIVDEFDSTPPRV